MELQKRAGSDLTGLAHTYLKIGVVLSMMNMHQEALNFCERASGIFLAVRNGIKDDTIVEDSNEGEEFEGCLLENPPTIFYALSRSLYMVGLCQIRLGDKIKALEYFSEGYKQAYQDLGAKVDLTKWLKKRRDCLSKFDHSNFIQVVTQEPANIKIGKDSKKEVLMKIKRNNTPKILRPAVKLMKPLKMDTGNLIFTKKKITLCFCLK